MDPSIKEEPKLLLRNKIGQHPLQFVGYGLSNNFVEKIAQRDWLKVLKGLRNTIFWDKGNESRV